MTSSSHRCFNCNDACSEDQFCYGCSEYVCNDCAINYDTGPGHDPDEHLELYADLGPEEFENEEEDNF